MNISTEHRNKLCEGLECLIYSKKLEINEILNRTEEHYSIDKQFEGEKFSLERNKERDIQEVRHQITELRELQHQIDSLENHILIVPNSIQLQLSIK